jgi:N-methylhydantoinase A/oxoprolinase/acetone carboxylase beta subunit
MTAYEVGQVGLLERENAAILNAAILPFARKTIGGFYKAMKSLNLSCPLYLTQNDGTLTDAHNASRLPIRTFSSGATNSMRGAAYLTGTHLRKPGAAAEPIIVLDIGGTTTDVGVLLPSGFPRQAASYVNISDIRTNFAMPDVVSIGLGGGSRVREHADGHVTVGPDSVGNALLQDAIVFGGNLLTATDVAARCGVQNVGDRALVKHLDAEFCKKAYLRVTRMLEKVIDKMKTSKQDIQVVMVGGGTIIAPEQLAGVYKILVPEFATVANAVGAAISKVGSLIGPLLSSSVRLV